MVRGTQDQRRRFLRCERLCCQRARILKIIHFFDSRTKLTRGRGENSCASGQTWYRKGTELVLTGRKLDRTCTKSVLVGIGVEKLVRSKLRTDRGSRVEVVQQSTRGKPRARQSGGKAPHSKMSSTAGDWRCTWAARCIECWCGESCGEQEESNSFARVGSVDCWTGRIW